VAEWERAKSRVLTDAEIRAFVAAAAARNDGVGDLWRLVLMTGARLSQLVEANFAADTITISDAKGRGSRVKLCVLPVVEAMRPLVARAALVRALHIDTVRKAGAAMLPEDATPNDIRRTVETRLQGLGVSREMRGALLSHGNGGVQARHYEHGDLLPQKAAVLAAWAAEIQRLAMLK
jgi:integrase